MSDPAGESAAGHEPPGTGGDPACWLAWVCPECGFFSERAWPDRCERCGAPFGEE